MDRPKPIGYPITVTLEDGRTYTALLTGLAEPPTFEYSA